MQAAARPTMLGTEYNWLISVSEPDEGVPRVRLASTGLLTVAVAAFCLGCVSLNAGSTSRELRGSGHALTKATDATSMSVERPE